ncbi:MAG: aminotransferase class I/II-fold pyridoxal phosphate-dependent enzyme [bacterium]|nr:aminotransferase class I/II-fold pyridoxal phosphate-dependent enzyme [bacterium]
MTESKFLKGKIDELEAELEQLKSTQSEEEYFKKRSADRIKMRADQMMAAKNQAFDTVALWGMYGKEDIKQYKSFTLPLFMTTAGGSYDSLVDGALMLSYQTVNDPNKCYSRIDNVTPDHLAWKFAALEGLGVPNLTQGLCTSSGMSAIMMVTMAFLKSGDNFVSSNRVYGGTEQLFNVTYPKSGWNVKWITEPWDLKKWEEQIDEKTKFLYVEFPSNPTLFVADLPALAELAHSHNIPLIVDSTLASPALTRPLELGADLVLHSTSKVSNGSCRAIGGVIVGKAKIVTKDAELQDDFVNKLKGGHFRNMGPCLSPFNSLLIWDEMSTIRIRMKEHCEKALKIAQFLEKHPMIEAVNYPGLSSHPQHEIAKKLMKLPDGTNGYGFLLSFNIKGGLEQAKKFAEAFDFGVQVTHLGGSYTVWVHNATTTHGQMSPEERKEAGVLDNMIRYSVGLEGADDAIKALEKALDSIPSTN